MNDACESINVREIDHEPAGGDFFFGRIQFCFSAVRSTDG